MPTMDAYPKKKRFELAKTAFIHTTHYDSAISTYLANLETDDIFGDMLTFVFRRRIR